MSKPKILIYIHYMEIGGAERALLGLLDAIDPDRVDVDLFVNQHTGELLDFIPKYVRLLPQLPEYSAIERPIIDIVKEGHFGIAFRRLLGKYRHNKHFKTLSARDAACDRSIFQYVFRSVSGGLRPLDYLGEYDLAISFLHPHNIVAEKVDAKKKICWIHTDYSTIYVDTAIEAPVWAAFDGIAAISDDAAKAFINKFPALKQKVFTFENLLPANLIRTQADAFDVHSEMPDIDGELKILSIGRFTQPKRFDDIPRMCRVMLDSGLKFKWYIIGFGPSENIHQNIEKYGVKDIVVLLGKKSNPYPYIKACDIYAQPSLFEGKSVTVREAQILGRPPVISNYPTAKSQLTDGVDGAIVPLDVDRCAEGIAEFAKNKVLRQKITAYLNKHDFSSADSIRLLYELIAK